MMIMIMMMILMIYNKNDNDNVKMIKNARMQLLPCCTGTAFSALDLLPDR